MPPHRVHRATTSRPAIGTDPHSHPGNAAPANVATGTASDRAVGISRAMARGATNAASAALTVTPSTRNGSACTVIATKIVAQWAIASLSSRRASRGRDNAAITTTAATSAMPLVWPPPDSPAASQQSLQRGSQRQRDRSAAWLASVARPRDGVPVNSRWRLSVPAFKRGKMSENLPGGEHVIREDDHAQVPARTHCRGGVDGAGGRGGGCRTDGNPAQGLGEDHDRRSELDHRSGAGRFPAEQEQGQERRRPHPGFQRFPWQPRAGRAQHLRQVRRVVPRTSPRS